jgi:hypothetical protein
MTKQFKQFNTTSYYVYENVINKTNISKNKNDESNKFNYFIHSEELNYYISNKRAGKSTAEIEETNEIETILKHGINITDYNLQSYFPVHRGNINEYSNKYDLTQIYKYIKMLKLLHCLLINEHDEVLENNTDIIIDRDNVIIIKSQLLDSNLLKYICYNKRFDNKIQYKEGVFENNDIHRTKMNLDVEYKTDKYTLNPDALPLIYYPHSVKKYIKENITFNEEYLNKLNIHDDYLIKIENENETLSDESLNKIHHAFVKIYKNINENLDEYKNEDKNDEIENEIEDKNEIESENLNDKIENEDKNINSNSNSTDEDNSNSTDDEKENLEKPKYNKHKQYGNKNKQHKMKKSKHKLNKVNSIIIENHISKKIILIVLTILISISSVIFIIFTN